MASKAPGTRAPWDPAKHPRDSKGRFTKSRTVNMTAGHKKQLKTLAGKFEPAGEKPTPSRLNPDQQAAVDSYRNGGFAQTNAALRSATGGDPAEVEQIDAAMRPLPGGVIVHRVVPLAGFGKVDPASLEGKVVRDAAYSSTQLDDPGPVAGVRMHVVVPAGTGALVTDDGEVILARDTELAVTGVTPDGQGGYDMHLAVLTAKEAPDAPADPLDGIDLRKASDDELAELMGDPDAFDRVAAELDRRERLEEIGKDFEKEDADAPLFDEPAEDTEEDRRIGDLIAQGWEYRDAYAEVHDLSSDDLDRQERLAALAADRRPGEHNVDKQIRRMYAEMVHTQYVEAEFATRGHMLTKAGEAEGIDPTSLFSGPAAVARKYASEDLLRWWAEHPRVTYVEFHAAILGRQRDVEAAAATKRQGNDKDFGV